MSKQRLKRIQIDAETFFNIMALNTSWAVKAGVPKGAQMRGVTVDPYSQKVIIFVEHKTFEEIDMTEVVPILETKFVKIK